MRHLFRVGVSVAAIVCAASVAEAQETASSIRGTVTANGAPVAGADVTITHVPSGTRNTATTDASGNFSASGLRIGGPFTVSVKADGFSDATVTDINLVAGQPLRLPVELQTANDIVVTASKVKAVELSPGPLTVMTRADIEGVASTRRDIRDIARRDPFATMDPGQNRGIMIAGQNARLNKFSVDGLRFTDTFGLNTGGLPTGRGPVPLDAIEQMSVKVAPFDISEGDFQGGSINLVLRSGGNRFSGSGFYTFNSDGLTSTRTQALSQNLHFTSKNWGGFLSGPIIKDKLFFALSYERLEETQPTLYGLASGQGQPIPNLTQGIVDQIGAIAKGTYNYDTGGLYQAIPETDEKYTAKIDWNIAEGHRFAFTYIHNKGLNGADQNSSLSNAASPALALKSDDYLRPEIVNSYVGEFNSDWAGNLHTQLRGNFRKYDLSPVPFGATPFSEMQVCTDQTTTGSAIQCSQTGVPRVYFGPDRFRHFNYVRTQQYGADASVRWEWQDISMKLTGSWEHYDIANAFAASAWGSYYFDSLADLQAGKAGSMTLQGSIDGNLNSVLASFKYDQFTFGVQGAWDPSPDFNLTAGIRADLYSMPGRPPLNVNFLNRYAFPNTGTLNGRMVTQPRLSFSWSPIDTLKVRGGIGLFAGGAPDVFVGNSFSVAGVYGNTINISRNADGSCTAPNATVCNAALNGVTGTSFNSAVTDYLRTNTASLANAPVNAMARNFRIPSTWKTSLSVDWTGLGTGWNLGGDFYYGFVQDAAIYKDLRMVQVGTLPDGRPRYAATGGSNTDLLLTNSSRGHSLVAVARADKTFDWGLSVGGSYTFQDVTDMSSMNGTTASGTYGQDAMVDPNQAAYGTSIYQVRNSWKMHVDFDHAFFGDNKTRFSLFGELRSGLPYSLTMNEQQAASRGTVTGTAGTSNRFLLYVPTVNDTKVVFDTPASQAAFNTIVDSYGLGKYRGQILPKNSQRSPNWFKVDLHVDQEVPLPLLPAKVVLFADMENVLNFINRDWGALKQVTFPYLASVVTVSCVANGGNACAQYQYSGVVNPALVNQTRISLWALRVGAKVRF